MNINIASKIDIQYDKLDIKYLRYFNLILSAHSACSFLCLKDAAPRVPLLKKCNFLGKLYILIPLLNMFSHKSISCAYLYFSL